MTIKPTAFDALNPATMSRDQLGELAGVLARVTTLRTVLDNAFAENLKELANLMHPEPQDALMTQVNAWVANIGALLDGQSAEINRILGVQDQGDEPTETLQ